LIVLYSDFQKTQVICQLSEFYHLAPPSEENFLTEAFLGSSLAVAWGLYVG
jgi:hypothetical protein